jgi:hypothetical protein
MQDAASTPSGEIIARIESVLDALADTRRTIASLHADEVRLLAEATELATEHARLATPDLDADIPVRSMSAQIGACLRVSDRTVQRRMSDAVILDSRFPETLAALARGDIDRCHALVIVEAGLPIDDAGARAIYERAAVEVACRETPGRLRPAVRTLAHRLHPVPLAERHRAAAARRDVWVRDADDGMAELVASLPAPIAHGIHDRLTRLARTVHEDGDRDSTDDTAERDTLVDDTASTPDARRLGEIRADVLADLLLTGHATASISAQSTAVSTAIVAHVQITVPALTLLGSGTRPAELAGHGPIDPSTARALAAGAPGWERVLTDPVSGCVLSVDRYRPTEHLRRALRVRDEHCRFPGCRQPARRCDIDHTVARQHDGPTELGNLAHLCRRHHVLKHHSAWRVRQQPDGVLEWTSPTGRIYPDRPARVLTFLTADDPPADRAALEELGLEPDPPPF